MKKVISLFQRNYGGDHLVRDEVVPGADWVIAGEGVATQKLDGTALLVVSERAGPRVMKRYTCRDFKQLALARLTKGFVQAQPPDPVTGEVPGWVPYYASADPGDKWIAVGLDEWIARNGSHPPAGTYELVGVGVQGNAERLPNTVLVRHGEIKLRDCPRTYEALREWFRGRDIEGVVWHHPDGSMVKIKKKDFGMKRAD